MKDTLKVILVSVAAVSTPSIFAGGDLVQHIRTDTARRGNLVACVDCPDIGLPVSLAGDGKRLVQCLYSDAQTMQGHQKLLKAHPAYGRLSVRRLIDGQLPYINNLVNGLVVYATENGPSTDEMLRVLAPFGTAYVVFPSDEKAKAFEASLKQESAVGIERPFSSCVQFSKPYPKDRDEWTHWMHAADNNPVAQDTVVDVPRNLQWVQSPTWMTSHNLNPGVSAMVTSGGRLFSIMNEAPPGIGTLQGQWTLTARDAFNGLVLWKQPIKEWGWKQWSEQEETIMMRFVTPFQVMRRLVAVGDRVFVTPGFSSPVQMLDAATGKELRTFQGTEKTFEILYDNGTLLLAVNHAIGADTLLPDVSVLAVNPDTGATLWRTDGFRGASWRLNSRAYKLANAFMTAGSGRVYLIDRDDVVCLDRKDGREMWRTPRPEKEQQWTDADVQTLGRRGERSVNLPVLRADQYLPNNCTLVYSDGVVLLSELKDEPATFKTFTSKAAHVVAMDAASGDILWRFEGVTFAHCTPPDLFVNEGLVWALDGRSKSYVGLDLMSGKKQKAHDVKDVFWERGHHKCFRNKATARMIFSARIKVETIGFADGAVSKHGWIKGYCDYGLMPANGMVYFPPHNCSCNNEALLKGFRALTAESHPVPNAVASLQPGPAYGRLKAETPNMERDSDWPMYRHDPARTGTGAASISARPTKAWETSLGGRLSQAIAVGERVYVASKDSHTVYCLSRKTGDVAWRFMASGRIDSSPTYSSGRIVVGSRDGHVYCLEAKTGARIWTFRAAPNDVQLLARDQLESNWPVHGSVVVSEAKVYALAGRSPHLNGGMYLYALDLPTGNVLQQARMLPDLESDEEIENSVKSDLIVAVGDKMHIRGAQFDADDIKEISYKGVDARFRATGSFLDDNWFNTSVWQSGSIQAQSLAHTRTDVYGVLAHSQFGQSAGHDVFRPAGKGYRLFRRSLSQPDKLKRRRTEERPKDIWSVQIPLRAQSLLVSGDRLYLAGARDQVEQADPWGHIEGRLGGLLVVHDTTDGRKLSEQAISSAPVFDGLSACGDNLFLVDVDGRVICYR